MSEDPNNSNNQGQEQSGSSADAWREVGRQFQAMGESLSEAVRLAWHDAENQRRLQEMKTGLERMVAEIDSAIRTKASSPEGQRFQADVKQAAKNLRDAGNESIQEIRPRLVSALKQVNDQLQKWVEQMEHEDRNPPEG